MSNVQKSEIIIQKSEGEIGIDRSYHYDKNSGKHRFLLDEILGLPKYERVDRYPSECDCRAGKLRR
jgi:hypothetical protein